MKQGRNLLPWFCLIALSILYWMCAGSIAANRPLWFDELATWHVAGLPPAEMWGALHDGSDQALPLSHLSARLSQSVFGHTAFAIRIPSLAGFWAACLCIYFFLRRRVPAPFALAGFVFPALTYAWGYAYEARSYGILLAGGALALVSWQAATEGRGRPFSLIAISVGLAIPLACNFAAVLLAIPFALGEIMRSVTRRKIDFPVWAAFAAAAPVMVIYPGLLASTNGWKTDTPPTLAKILPLYSVALESAMVPVLGAGLAAYAFAGGRKEPPEEAKLPRHEAVALAGFVLAPLAFRFAAVVTPRSWFVPRYGIICIIGIACWAAILLFRASRGDSRAAAAALAVAILWLVQVCGHEASQYAAQPPSKQFELENPLLLEAVADGSPVVSMDALIALPADFYLPVGVLQRVYYVTAPAIPNQSNLNDNVMASLARHVPLRIHVDPWRIFAARRQRFLLYARTYEENHFHAHNGMELLAKLRNAEPVWMFARLLEEGWHFALRVRQGGESIFEVTPPGGTNAAAAKE